MFWQRWSVLGLVVVCLVAVLRFFPVLLGRGPSPVQSPQHSGARDGSQSGPLLERPAGANPEVEPLDVVLAEDPWEFRWRELSARPEAPERDLEMAAMLEELAARDPARALSLAGEGSASEVREAFMQAALRGWGGSDPEAAFAWVALQATVDQGVATAAIFHGAVRDPENAVRLTRQWSQGDPGRAQEYGSCLIAALNGVREFRRAAGFAADASAEFRVDLLNAAYAGWADLEPEAAMKSIEQLDDAKIRETAFHAGISRWANDDGEGAAKYALALPEGPERRFGVTAGVRAWAVSDVVEAATWMGQLEPSPETDLGMAIIASQPEALEQPKVAVTWAQMIVDPPLRVRVLATIVKHWAEADSRAARRFAETSPAIRSEDRRGVMSAFDPDFSELTLLP